MKILYLELGMGAAGDMLTAALMELLPDREAFLAELNSIGIPDVTVSASRSEKCGITGTHVTVMVNGKEEVIETDVPGHHHEQEHHHEHENHHEQEHHHCSEHYHGQAHFHRNLAEIRQIIDGFAVSDQVKKDAAEVYQIIAEAESRAHGKPVTEIHFHEVGMMDAIADVVAVSMLMERLAPDKVIASPVHVGSGYVQCAHGILPVPAPATAYILQGIPTCGGGIRGELCTPTGAALLKHFVSEYGSQPEMCVKSIGYGMGKKDFEIANCVRAMIGEGSDSKAGKDTVCGLSCNVDDMTAERIAFAVERIFEAGAREVFTQPVSMKKSRTGILIQVLCHEAEKDAVVRQIFKHTTTIGIREQIFGRYVLDRTVETIETPWGKVRQKRCSGYGVEKMKYEYEDLARIAGELNISIEETAGMVDRA